LGGAVSQSLRLGLFPVSSDINGRYRAHKFYFLKAIPMQRSKSMRWTRACWPAKVNVLASEAHGYPLHAPGENWRKGNDELHQ
jgi:hypothetical protein